MFDDQQLEILESGVEKWNKWKSEHSNIILKLSVADLHGAKLAGVDLSRVDLSEADLSNANLSKANLSEADLSDSDLSGADLSGADLSGADLSRVDLSRANLIRADLSGANLSGANLFRTDLARVDLSSAILDGTYLENTTLDGTIIGLTDLSTVKGLDSVEVHGQCIIDFETLRTTRNLPKSFLLKLGLPELYIDYLPDFYSNSLTYYPVFLCHSKENREFARKLYEALIARGVNVFFDEKKLKPGDSLVKTIKHGIQLYDKTIVVCSNESLASTWVDYELELLLKKEQSLIEQKGNEDIGLLIPITIDDHIFTWKGPKEWDIKNRFIGDFKDWQNEKKFENALNELIQALNVNRPFIQPYSHFEDKALQYGSSWIEFKDPSDQDSLPF